MERISSSKFSRVHQENINTNNVLEINDPFLKEQADPLKLRENDGLFDINGKVATKAYFSQLNELTSMLGKYKHSMTSKSGTERPHVKVYTENKHLAIYTIGGFRYFITTELPIIKVFPIEDGLIVKCRYDEKLLRVSFNRMPKDASYAYITVTKHPLEDMHPLSFREKNITTEFRDMVDCTQDLLYVSQNVPLAIYFDENTQHLVFTTLRHRYEEVESLEDSDRMDTGEEEVKTSFDQFFKKRRHKLINKISADSEIFLNPIIGFPLEDGVKPDSFEITNTLEENTLLIAAHFSSKEEVNLYSCHIGQESEIFSISFTAKIQNISKMYTVDFLAQEDFSLPKI